MTWFYLIWFFSLAKKFLFFFFCFFFPLLTPKKPWWRGYLYSFLRVRSWQVEKNQEPWEVVCKRRVFELESSQCRLGKRAFDKNTFYHSIKQEIPKLELSHLFNILQIVQTFIVARWRCLWYPSTSKCRWEQWRGYLLLWPRTSRWLDALFICSDKFSLSE